MGSRTHGVWANDGGEDAPLTPRGRALFRAAVVCVVVAGVALVVLTRFGF